MKDLKSINEIVKDLGIERVGNEWHYNNKSIPVPSIAKVYDKVKENFNIDSNDLWLWQQNELNPVCAEQKGKGYLLDNNNDNRFKPIKY
jgi:hypothetical protein